MVTVAAVQFCTGVHCVGGTNGVVSWGRTRTVALLVLVLLATAPGGKRVPFTTGPSDAAVVVSEASVVVMEVDIAAAGQSRRGRAKTMNNGSGDGMARMRN